MLHLVTDTTAYLPARFTERWSIHTVPLKVTMGNQAIDEDKVSLQRFYEHLAVVETAPFTSQPAPGEFMQLYEQLTRNGDEVLSIHISSGLSGTARVAQLAAEEIAPDLITVIDSESATCGLALMLSVAVEALEAGQSRAEIADRITKIREIYAGIFLVETLEYLKKGGRINGAAKFLGNVLQLRPLLYMNTGKIEGLTVARTRKRGMQQLLDEVEKRVGSGPLRIAVTHIQCAEDAERLAEQAQARFDCADFFIHETGPVIGSHVGPGFVGLAACPAQL